MQQQGRGEVISSPRIVTSNQKEAVIRQEQGNRLPDRFRRRGGNVPTVRFEGSAAQLKVTPTITNDGRVFLNMGVKDELDGFISLGSFGEVPQIAKREVNTAVLVEDGPDRGDRWRLRVQRHLRNHQGAVPRRRHPAARQPVPQQEPQQEQGRAAGVRDAEGRPRRPALTGADGSHWNGSERLRSFPAPAVSRGVRTGSPARAAHANLCRCDRSKLPMIEERHGQRPHPKSSRLHAVFRGLRDAACCGGNRRDQSALIERLLIALLADGHLLVEGRAGARQDHRDPRAGIAAGGGLRACSSLPTCCRPT